MKKRAYYLLTFLGVLLGLCTVYSVWFFYFFTILLFIAVFLKKSLPANEAWFLIRLFFLLLFLRLAVVLLLRPFIAFYGNGVDLFGDGMAYGLNGLFITEALKHDFLSPNTLQELNNKIFTLLPLDRYFNGRVQWLLPYWVGTLPPFQVYQVSSLAYFLSFFYFFFGFKPILPIFFNCLLGAVLSINVYYFIRRITQDLLLSRIGAILIGLWPTLFLWSVVSLKEIIVVSLSMISLQVWSAFLEKSKWLYILVLAGLTWAILTLRPNFTAPFVVFYFLTIVATLARWAYRKKIMLFFIVFVLLFSGICLNKVGVRTISSYAHEKLKTSLMTHTFQVYKGGTFYKILDDRFYDFEVKSSFILLKGLSDYDIAKAYFRGALHFIFEPFPFRVYNTLNVPIFPFVICGYLIIPLFLLGVLVSLTLKRNFTIILLCYLVIFSSTIILGEGNVGGLIRHRDIVTPIVITFAVMGVSLFLKHRAKSNEM